MRRTPFIAAARRSAVAPRAGAFSSLGVADLTAPLIGALLEDAGISAGEVDEIILGNALYGGGNPARLAALQAGLSEAIPALTIDTQCCSGLDAIMLAADRIRAGAADAILAGGAESFSRAPIRQHRPVFAGEMPMTYDRPPFTPWPHRDPGMLEAAALLAAESALSRNEQEAFAIESHLKALANKPFSAEIVAIANLSRDAFARRLSQPLCSRLPALAGEPEFALTAATVAVEADAAAMVLVLSETALSRLRTGDTALRILGSRRIGGDPERPGLAPIAAMRSLLQRLDCRPDELAGAEIMEAFAAQAMACMAAIGLDPTCVNRGGGALARGHPIGASGAILAVRLFHELRAMPFGTRGLAAIAAAGGLGSALALGR